MTVARKVVEAMAMRRPLDVARDTSDGVIVITPSRVRDYAACPYKFAHDARRFDPGNRSLQVGVWIHELIHVYNLTRIDGREPRIDDVIAHKAPPALFMDGGDDEERVLAVASDSLHGYRAFLEAQNIDRILDAERYVRTPPRPVVGVPDRSIVISGRFDVVGLREDRSLACVDVKTGRVPTRTQLAAAADSFVYWHLAAYAYGDVSDGHAIDIVQMNPLTGDLSSVRLTEDQIREGRDVCRRMILAIKQRSFPPRPADHCAFCALASECPAHQARPDGWDTAF